MPKNQLFKWLAVSTVVAPFLLLAIYVFLYALSAIFSPDLLHGFIALVLTAATMAAIMKAAPHALHIAFDAIDKRWPEHKK